jgi:hypothetical protein
LNETRTLTPARNPDMIDRSRGTATGGVTADRIGFSKELSLSQLRQVDRQTRPQSVNYSASSRGAIRGEFSADTSNATYGRDGKLLVSAGATVASGGVGTVQLTRNSQAAPTTSTGSVARYAMVPESSAQEPRLPAAASPLESRGRSGLTDQQVRETADTATKSLVQRETQVQQRTGRSDAATAQAQRLGESQNTERPAPAQGENDVTRQRLVRAYQPLPMAAAAKLSVFA